MKKSIYYYFLILSTTCFSQVVDSTTIETEKLLQESVKQKDLYKEPINQKKRDKLYINEFQLKENNLFQTEQKNNKIQADQKIYEMYILQQKQVLSTIIDSDKKEEGQKEMPALEVDKKILNQEKLASKVESVSEIENALENSRARLIGPSQYDSRIELLQMNPSIAWQFSIFKKCESIGMIIEKEKLNQIAKNLYALDISQTLGKTYSLCLSEPFSNQVVAGIGTAFIYSNNTMITAKHVFERPLKDYVVLFGFKIVNITGAVENYYDASNLYYPKSIVSNIDDLDIVQFSVDRNFDRPVLEWEDSKKIKKEESEIYMLGHPNGLPIKVALNASIEDDSSPLFYYTSLDSFQGNSGSPVFNFFTNKVIGILVSGELDYKFNGNCNYSPVCKVPYCKGEKVIRIEEIIKRL